MSLQQPYLEIDGVTLHSRQAVIDDYGQFDDAEWKTRDGVWFVHIDDLQDCACCEEPIFPGEPFTYDSKDRDPGRVHEACIDDWEETLSEPSYADEHRLGAAALGVGRYA